MSIAESGKQTLFTRAPGERYGNYQITCVRTREADYNVERLLLHGLLFAGVGSLN